MKFGSICSGIEAASVASKHLGWQAQWFSEIETFPCAVLAHHYPDVPNLGDMTKIYDKPEFTTREVDLICGGTPCQAFSVAGQRKGLADERGNLSLEFCKIVHAKRPKWVLWENVPGVLSSKDNAFGCFLAGLSGADTPLLPGTRDGKWASAGIVSSAGKESGYGLAWRVIDAQYFGVPQRRRRVFVVGYLGDWARAAKVLFECAGVSGNPAESRETGKGTARAFETGPCGGRATNIAPTLDTRCKDGPIRNQGGLAILNRMTAIGEYSQDGTFSTVKARDYKDATDLVVYENHAQDSRIKEVNVAPQLNAKAGTGGGNLPIVFEPQGCDVYNQSLTGDVAATVTAKAGDPTCSGPKVLTISQVRRLTPRECERLQGFPDDYTLIPWRNRRAADCPDGPRYKALGNSWAVPCVKWIFDRIEAVKLCNSQTVKNNS